MTDTRMHPSDEASRTGLELARKAGAAYQDMLRYFVEQVAHCGSIRETEDYRIALAVEKAEPLWYPCGDGLKLHEPPRDANQHLEVFVCDRSEGRFLPQMQVTVTLLKDGSETATWDLPFLWHPTTMFHYGRSVRIAQGGPHTVRVSVAPPGFPRHDNANGQRYVKPVVVKFAGIDLQPAREAH